MTLLEKLCDAAASFHARGYAFGSTGNLSARDGDDIWITPTGRSFRGLAPADFACISLDGTPHNRNKPSKEYPFHLGCYRANANARALVHLHSHYAVALSCLEDPTMPILTPYYLMRVAPLGIVPYHRPGSAELGAAVEQAAKDHDCLLLLNHGLITLGRTLDEAIDRAEELEETARLHFELRHYQTRELTADQQAAIWDHYRR